MDFNEMVSGSAPDPASGVPAAPDYSMMMTPPGVDMSQMRSPAQSPQELEKRVTGWQALIQKFQTDPNLQRAIGLAGAMLAQPRQIGQTGPGQVANAAVVGMNAYGMGQQAQTEQALRLREEARKQGTFESQQARVPGEIAHTQAQTGALEQQTQTAKETAPYTVERARTESEALQQRLDTARSEEEVAQVERAVRAKTAAIKAAIPDETQAAAVLSELQAASLKAEEARARIRNQEGTAAQHEAKGQLDQLTRDIVMKLPPEEQKAFALKTGKYGSGGQSALERHRDVYSAIYDQLPESDPRKKSQTKDQFVLQQLSSTKSQDAVKALSDYLKAMDIVGREPDSDIVQMLNEEIKQRRGGGGATPPSTQPGANPAAAPGAAPASGGKPPKMKPPKVGEVQQGYKFKGGNPADPANWEKQ